MKLYKRFISFVVVSLFFIACGDNPKSPSEPESSSSEIESSSEQQVSSSSVEASVVSSSSQKGHLSWDYLNPAISYGEFTDERDGQVYKYVEIYRYRVMAENLNFADSVNYPNLVGNTWCPYDNQDSCSKYGRYYSWPAAFNADSTYGHSALSMGTTYNPFFVSNQGICPEGWLVAAGPYYWKDIFYDATTKDVCSKKGWSESCTDSLGLSALPNGYYDNGEIKDFGTAFCIWTPAEQQTSSSHMGVFEEGRSWSRILRNKNLGAAVRCYQSI